MNTEGKTILGIYPNAKGCGFALFHNGEIIDYGMPSTITLEKRLAIIKKYIAKTQPNIIITRCDGKGFQGSQRTSKMLAGIYRIAQDAGVFSFAYSRNDMQKAFKEHGPNNKEDIAELICGWFPLLEEKLPPKRKLWHTQHRKMNLFDAIALVYTHLYFSQ